jgi:glycosyltransferase involved in cell wall biosynthesis
MSQLSILIPAYNESKTIFILLEKISTITLIGELEKEIIVINDASTDDTESEIFRFQRQYPEINLQYSKHNKNQGKGAALHTGIRQATGEYIVIQDADLEYDPREYNLLLKPMIEGFADVVYGSRFMGGRPHRILFFWHSIGNHFLTFLSNLFTDLNLTDIESGYKMFKADKLKKLQLKEKKFGFEPEVTAKISRIPHIRIYEVGISYYGRTYAEGKKVKWKDGFRAIYCILKYNLWAQ